MKFKQLFLLLLSQIIFSNHIKCAFILRILTPNGELANGIIFKHSPEKSLHEELVVGTKFESESEFCQALINYIKIVIIGLAKSKEMERSFGRELFKNHLISIVILKSGQDFICYASQLSENRKLEIPISRTKFRIGTIGEVTNKMETRPFFLDCPLFSTINRPTDTVVWKNIYLIHQELSKDFTREIGDIGPHASLLYKIDTKEGFELKTQPLNEVIIQSKTKSDDAKEEIKRIIKSIKAELKSEVKKIAADKDKYETQFKSQEKTKDSVEYQKIVINLFQSGIKMIDRLKESASNAFKKSTGSLLLVYPYISGNELLFECVDMHVANVKECKNLRADAMKTFLIENHPEGLSFYKKIEGCFMAIVIPSFPLITKSKIQYNLFQTESAFNEQIRILTLDILQYLLGGKPPFESLDEVKFSIIDAIEEAKTLALEHYRQSTALEIESKRVEKQAAQAAKEAAAIEKKLAAEALKEQKAKDEAFEKIAEEKTKADAEAKETREQEKKESELIAKAQEEARLLEEQRTLEEKRINEQALSTCFLIQKGAAEKLIEIEELLKIVKIDSERLKVRIEKTVEILKKMSKDLKKKSPQQKLVITRAREQELLELDVNGLIEILNKIKARKDRAQQTSVVAKLPDSTDSRRSPSDGTASDSRSIGKISTGTQTTFLEGQSLPKSPSPRSSDYATSSVSTSIERSEESISLLYKDFWQKSDLRLRELESIIQTLPEDDRETIETQLNQAVVKLRLFKLELSKKPLIGLKIEAMKQDLEKNFLKLETLIQSSSDCCIKTIDEQPSQKHPQIISGEQESQTKVFQQSTALCQAFENPMSFGAQELRHICFELSGKEWRHWLGVLKSNSTFATQYINAGNYIIYKNQGSQIFFTVVIIEGIPRFFESFVFPGLFFTTLNIGIMMQSPWRKVLDPKILCYIENIILSKNVFTLTEQDLLIQSRKS